MNLFNSDKCQSCLFYLRCLESHQITFKTVDVSTPCFLRMLSDHFNEKTSWASIFISKYNTTKSHFYKHSVEAQPSRRPWPCGWDHNSIKIRNSLYDASSLQQVSQSRYLNPKCVSRYHVTPGSGHSAHFGGNRPANLTHDRGNNTGFIAEILTMIPP